MGFQKPSKIQERALPLLLQNPCVWLRLARSRLLTSTLIQSEEHDRAIAVGNREDCSLCLDDALSRRYGSQAAAGTLSLSHRRTSRR